MPLQAAPRAIPAVRSTIADPVRLRALRTARVLECADDVVLDRWTALARRTTDAPVALISIVHADGQHFASAPGLTGWPAERRGTPLSHSLCKHVVETAGAVVIPDARADSRYSANGAVHELGILAYLGAPIVFENQVLGSLCVLDFASRQWTEMAQSSITDIANAVSTEIALRAGHRLLRSEQRAAESRTRAYELIAGRAPLPTIMETLVAGLEAKELDTVGVALRREHDGRIVARSERWELAGAGLQEVDGFDEALTRIAARLGRPLASSVQIGSADTSAHVLAIFGERAPLGLGDAARIAELAIERSAAEARLLHVATHDPLTGLLNRTAAFVRLTEELESARRSSSSLAVLFADLDRLKLVNDSLGHDRGDEILATIAQRVRETAGEHAIAARFGGDELVVVLPGCRSQRAAEDVAQALLISIAAPLASGADVAMTASVGVALVDAGEVDAREAVRRADAAMCEAKRHGGNGYAVYADASVSNASSRRLRLISHLRNAVGREQLSVVFQPVVRMADMEVTGVEALLRWKHPHFGSVSPAEFIPMAESTGQISEIGEWVLRTACSAMSVVRDATAMPLAVGVNLSARQIQDSDFPATLERVLAETGQDPRLLILELTETALLDPTPETAHALKQIDAMGVNLVLDDFGTGFSSLSALKRHPIKAIKVDRSFVRGLPAQNDDAAIVAAVIGMAKSLGRRVTAEGVETEEQLQTLQALGCDHVQGYLLGRPMSAEQLVARLGRPLP